MITWLTYACGCSGTLGIGFYGNEEMKKGDNSVHAAANDTKDIVADIHLQVCLYKVTVHLW